MSGPKIMSMGLYGELDAINRRIMKLVTNCKCIEFLLKKEHISTKEVEQYLDLVNSKFGGPLPLRSKLQDSDFDKYMKLLQSLESKAPDLSALRKKANEAQRARWEQKAKKEQPQQVDSHQAQKVAAQVEALNRKLEALPMNLASVAAAKRRIAEIQQNYSQSPSSQLAMLHSFETFQLPEVEKESHLQECRTQYEALCSLCGMQPAIPADHLQAMEAACAEMQELCCQRKQEQYIQNALDETMKEMGYAIIGASQDKETQSTNKLYRLQGEAVLNVVYASNGQVTMQVGKASAADRVPEKRELPQMVADMQHFCTQYPQICQSLTQKGLKLDTVCLLPPTAEFAQIINTEPFAPEKEKRQQDRHWEKQQKQMYLEE